MTRVRDTSCIFSAEIYGTDRQIPGFLIVLPELNRMRDSYFMYVLRKNIIFL